LRKKRGADREVAGALSPGDTFAGPTPVDDEPTPAEAAEFADQFDHLFESLNDEERRIVELKLDGCTNDEVAAKLNCSERTVRRLMKQLQARLETQLDTIDQSVG
jgi:RNA polymerase sigma factor (sigma-70 family)